MTATTAALTRRIARLETAITAPLTNTAAYTTDVVAMALQAGIKPDKWQTELLRCDSQFILVNCSRQTGKSQTAALLACHTAFTTYEATILLLSPSFRQSSELFRKCMYIYNKLNRPVAVRAETASKLELVNGSRILSLPGKEETIRGISKVTLLLLDEASRIPDALYTGVSPMRAVSNGRLMLMSTPYGTRGAFYEAYKNRYRDNWNYFEIPATACARISPEFLESEKRHLGEWVFQQEYMCQFASTQAAQFRTQDIDALVSEEVEQWELL